MPTVIIVTGDAAETLEVFYPYQCLLEAGYEVHLAAPEKRRRQFVVHDFVEGYDTYTEKLGHTWLADAGVLHGRTTSAYPAWQIDVELAGGIFENGAGVVDGNLVSGRTWPDNATWMREFMIVLESATGFAAAGGQTGGQPAETWSEPARATGMAAAGMAGAGMAGAGMAGAGTRLESARANDPLSGHEPDFESAGAYGTQPMERDRPDI